MRIGHKYIFPPFIALFFFLLGAALVPITDVLVDLISDALSQSLPAVLGRPSPIADPDGYTAYMRTVELITLLLTLLPVTYLSMRFDNKRFEYLVVLTEGLYTIPDTTAWHIRSFWLSDIISAALPPVLLTLPVFLIPEEYLSGFAAVFWCGTRLSPYFGAVWSLVIIISASIAMRLILIPAVLRAWRASWLTGSVD